MDAWRCGWSDSAAYWPMSGRTAEASAYLPLKVLGSAEARTDFLPKERFFCYPNPATGSSATIRYYVNQPAHVTITILDAIGDCVTEMHREITDGNRDDEVIWNLTGIASGVYHCRIQAEALSGSETATVFKAVAVVK